MNPEAVFTTLVQVPFLAAFIWFSLRLQNEFRKCTKDQELHWMEFLRAEREQRSMAMKQGMDQVTMLAESVHAIADSLVILTKELAEHTAGSEDRHRALVNSLDALHRRLDSLVACKVRAKT